MPFKMMNPLKKMDTAAMKTVQKSAMKLKDLNNDGETTKADLLIKKGVYNNDGSPKKKASGVNYMNESKSPAKVTGFGAVGAVIKDAYDKSTGKGKYLSKAGLSKYEINLLKGGISKGASKGLKESYNKAKAKQDAYNKKMSETGATSGGTGETVVSTGSGSRTEGGTSALKPENKKESSTTTTTNTTGKKTTAGGDRFSKAYEIAKKKYPKAYGKMTLAEYTAEAKKQIANRKETGKYIGGTKKLTEAEKKAAEQKKLKEAAEQKKLKEEKEAADNSDKIVKEAQLEKAKKEAEKAAAEKIRLAKAEEYNKKNLKPRSRSRRKVKVDVVKDKKTGARLKTKTRTRKDGTVKTKVKETRIIGGVASKTRKVEDDRKKRNKKDKNKNGKNGNSTGVNRR